MYIYICRYPNHSEGGHYYYVGQSIRTPEESTDYYGSGVFCQNYEKKYGKEYVRQNVKKKILRRDVKDKKTLDYLERLYIKNYRNKYGDLVMNLAEGGEGGSFPKSEEHRKKIGKANSIAHKGKTLSEETKKKIGEAHKGEKNHNYDHTIYHFRNVETGETYKSSQRNFMEKYSLGQGNVSALIRGERNHYKYWVLNDSKIKSMEDIKRIRSNALKGEKNSNYNYTIYHFRNIKTGKTFSGTAHDFYTRYGLGKSKVHDLVKGRTKHHKYWVLNDSGIMSIKDLKEGNKDMTIYTFRNIRTNQVFIGKRHDLCTHYNLNNSNIGMLVNRQRKSHKYWVLDDSELRSIEDLQHMKKGENNPNYNKNSMSQVYRKAYEAGDIKVSYGTFHRVLKDPNHKNHKKFTELRDKYTIKEATANE